jgi:hypothetical protein
MPSRRVRTAGGRPLFLSVIILQCMKLPPKQPTDRPPPALAPANRAPNHPTIRAAGLSAAADAAARAAIVGATVGRFKKQVKPALDAQVGGG